MLCESERLLGLRVEDFDGQDPKFGAHRKSVRIGIGSEFSRNQFFLVNNSSQHKVGSSLDIVRREEAIRTFGVERQVGSLATGSTTRGHKQTHITDVKAAVADFITQTTSATWIVGHGSRRGCLESFGSSIGTCFGFGKFFSQRG